MLLERHREQESEQHLHPGQRDPQLLQQLAEIAIEPFVFGLLPPRRPPLRISSLDTTRVFDFVPLGHEVNICPADGPFSHSPPLPPP